MLTRIKRNKDTFVGVYLLLLFALIEGFALGPIVGLTLKTAHGASIIGFAFGGTASIFLVCSIIAAKSQTDFSQSFGKQLGIALVVLLLISIFMLFVRIPMMDMALACFGLIIFTGFLLIDTQKALKDPEANYIMIALNIYLDLINIFIDLMRILGNKK